MEHVILAFICVILFTSASLHYTKGYIKLKELFTDKVWLINFVIVLAFCIYIFKFKKYENDEDSLKTKDAIKKAIIGFIIGLYSEVGLTIGPFWLIFVVAYYLQGYV